MATCPANTGAPARASSNVTRLPTAAARKPINHRFLAQREAARAMRAEQPWPGKLVATATADDALAAVRRTPELLMVMAILKTLPIEQRRAAQDAVHTVYWHSGDAASRAASMIVGEVG